MQTRKRRYYLHVEEYTLETLGQVIRQHREAKGLTQEQLGIAAAYSHASAGVSISRLEGGNLAPRADKLVAIAKALDVPWEALGLKPRRALELPATGRVRLTDSSRQRSTRRTLRYARGTPRDPRPRHGRVP